MNKKLCKKFVMYGAGNIGRGFIGQLLSKAGYEVVFVDVNEAVVNQLNHDHGYPVRTVAEEGFKEEKVTHVRAVNGMDHARVAEEIGTADLMATAVGVNILPRIVPNLLEGLRRRWALGNIAPFNIIICENLLDANQFLEGLLKEQMSLEEVALFDQAVGLVEASIGRMVPVMTPAMQEGNILRVWVEQYAKLPLDAKGFKGNIPEIPGMFVFQPFEYYIRRKLFVHNMGHAMAAYLGFLCGDATIYQSIRRPEVRVLVQNAMKESALALHKEFQVPLDEILDHVDDLIFRFGNKMLGDTVARVGKDPVRKLSLNDRLTGSMLLCEKLGLGSNYISIGIAAGLCFQAEGDPSAPFIQEEIAQNGVGAALAKYCAVSDLKQMERITMFYKMLQEKKPMTDLIAKADYLDSLRRA